MLALLLAASLLAPYGEARQLFTFDDSRITESSGLASSSRGDGVLFTHNDSGGGARFFAVDDAGRTLATYVLPGIRARDWEDMARGPDEQGRSSLFLADVGDNNGGRDGGVLVHRVPEPARAGVSPDPLTTPSPVSFRLVYPDEPQDAETLLVHPRTGRLLLVTKDFSGTSAVYAAPERLDAGAGNRLERVGTVRLTRTGTDGGPGIGAVAQLLVTAGDVSPDGTRVALRTYTDLYEWPVSGDDLAGAFAGTPTVTPLPPTEQGEGLTYSADGAAVLLSSEGRAAPVHRLERTAVVPGQPAPAPDPAGEPAGPPAPPGLPWGRVVVAAGVLLLALALARRMAGRTSPRLGR